mmetsp:Transcript_5946/g.17906  ORF Transcript_5946/g.17906 Transcript_5946/m.17906 type:complete len:245 (+) Transcript_5946:458-1192(+)
MSNPALPTGETYSTEEHRQLVQWVEAHGLWLFVDEGHALLYTDTILESPLSSEAPNHIAVFGGVSREFAAGGLRVGWMATMSSMLVNAVDSVRLAALPNFALRSCRVLLGAAAGGVFISGTEINRFMRQQKERFAINHKCIMNTVGAHAMMAPRSQQQHGLFCTVNLSKLSEEPSELLRALEKVNVKLNVLKMGTDVVARVNLSERYDVVAEGMRRLSDILHSQRISSDADDMAVEHAQNGTRE